MAVVQIILLVIFCLYRREYDDTYSSYTEASQKPYFYFYFLSLHNLYGFFCGVMLVLCTILQIKCRQG